MRWLGKGLFCVRSLATIQIIKEIKEIPDSDFIELALIQGWQCVVKKGDFKVGDMCVYFEVDSFLPLDSRFEFLAKSSLRENRFMASDGGESKGYRIRTATMRGQLSQGLAMPLALFPELSDVVTGLDVTDILYVRKWEVPEVAGGMGTAIGSKPFGIPTTDETRIQSMPVLLEVFKDKPYYITTKLDGTSCTIYCKDGKVGICGRNVEYKEEPEACAMWKWVYSCGLKDKLLSLGADIFVQGEFCGGGIQGNRLKLKEPNFFAFDLGYFTQDGSVSRRSVNDLISMCKALGIEMVPIEEAEGEFAYTLDALLDKARGKYESGLDKEGIVVRTQEPEWGTFESVKSDGTSTTISHRLSFKVLNNDFLKKEKE
jgi:RNA ligase (TIGR02306 family)